MIPNILSASLYVKYLLLYTCDPYYFECITECEVSPTIHTQTTELEKKLAFIDFNASNLAIKTDFTFYLSIHTLLSLLFSQYCFYFC